MEREVYFRHLQNESCHWWFKARREIISTIIKKNMDSNDKKLKILDFGSGSGTNIEMLNHLGNVCVYEKNEEIFNILKLKYEKLKNVKFIENFENEKFFDIILAADVIEHIKNDYEIVENFYKMLNPNGRLVLTVPAYNFLKSRKDEVLQHYRRYNKKSLRKLVSKYFKIIKISYFNFFLFIPIALTLIIFKTLKIDFIDKVEKKPNQLVNAFLYKIFSFEKYLLNFLSFPFGISIVAILKKKQND